MCHTVITVRMYLSFKSFISVKRQEIPTVHDDRKVKKLKLKRDVQSKKTPQGLVEEPS